MKKLLLTIILSNIALSEQLSDVINESTITKIAFGACNQPRKMDTPIFQSILKQKPDIFVFLGDNIYGDTEDMEILKKKYAALGNAKAYQELQAKTTVLATWDDHDYGVNDGGKGYKMRDESQQVFLDFFNEPTDSQRRKTPGIYASYSFGVEGKKVQILMLDTRYFRDDLKRFEGKKTPDIVGWYSPSDDTSKTLLGDAQWTWLEEQLQVKADVRIIASSIQMIAYKKGMENWGNLPHEQKRLFDLLKKHQANHTVAISGDVHFTELSKTMIGDYPMYDLTSSGLTHASAKWAKALNPFRVGKSHGVINAGLIEIDWDNASLALTSMNAQGAFVIEHKVPFSELEFPEE